MRPPNRGMLWVGHRIRGVVPAEIAIRLDIPDHWWCSGAAGIDNRRGNHDHGNHDDGNSKTAQARLALLSLRQLLLRTTALT